MSTRTLSEPPTTEPEGPAPGGGSPEPGGRSMAKVGLSVLAAVGAVVALVLVWNAFVSFATSGISDNGRKLLLVVFVVAIFAAIVAAVMFVVGLLPQRMGEWAPGYLFVLPVLLLIAVGLLYPALRTAYESFRDGNSVNFVGTDNYKTIFTDSEQLKVLRNTVLWVLVTPLLSTAIGLVYAVVVDRSRFESFAKALVFLPMAISLVGASIIWKFVYEYRDSGQGVEQIGLLNQVLVWLGFEPQRFLLNEPWNTFFLMVIMIWIQAGFAMTVLSAAIKAIPDDIIEAAKLDGVSGLRMFWSITIPSIRPALIVVLSTISITVLKVFDIVRTATGGNFGTNVVANEFYNQSFRQFNFGQGAALAMLLFVLVVPIVVYNTRQLRKAEGR